MFSFKFQDIVSDDKIEVNYDIDDFHFCCSRVMVLGCFRNDTNKCDGFAVILIASCYNKQNAQFIYNTVQFSHILC